MQRYKPKYCLTLKPSGYRNSNNSDETSRYIAGRAQHSVETNSSPLSAAWSGALQQLHMAAWLLRQQSSSLNMAKRARQRAWAASEPTSVSFGFERLFDGQLRLVCDFIHRVKRRQDIVPVSTKLRQLALAFCKQVASELHRLEDNDINQRRSSIITPFLVSWLYSIALRLLSPSATPSNLTCTLQYL
ncbi:hypothetical protein MRX96_042971 [Rhipicephalus microplus]